MRGFARVRSSGRLRGEWWGEHGGRGTHHVESARLARPARRRADPSWASAWSERRAEARGRGGPGRATPSRRPPAVRRPAPPPTADHVPPPPAYAPARRRPGPIRSPRSPGGCASRPRPAGGCCVLAGTLWVLMRVISAVQLVVLAFVAALLITALLQPTVARLKRLGLPRGLATAVTAILGLRHHGPGRLVRRLAGHGQPRQPLRPGPGRHRRAASAGCSTARSMSPSSRSTTSRRTSATPSAPTPKQITSAGLAGRHRDRRGPHRACCWRCSRRSSCSTTASASGSGRSSSFPAQARPGVAGAGPRAWRTLTAYVRGTVHRRPDRRDLHRARDLLPRRADGGAARRLHLPLRLHPAGRRGDLRSARGGRRAGHRRACSPR